jgi:hypothetical protein
VYLFQFWNHFWVCTIRFSISKFVSNFVLTFLIMPTHWTQVTLKVDRWTATASSFQSGQEPKNFADGDLTTVFSTSYTKQTGWFSLPLCSDSELLVTGVRLAHRWIVNSVQLLQERGKNIKVYVSRNAAGAPAAGDFLCNTDVDMAPTAGLQKFDCDQTTITDGRSGVHYGRYVKIQRDYTAPTVPNGGEGDGMIQLTELEVLGFYEDPNGNAVPNTKVCAPPAPPPTTTTTTSTTTQACLSASAAAAAASTNSTNGPPTTTHQHEIICRSEDHMLQFRNTTCGGNNNNLRNFACIPYNGKAPGQSVAAAVTPGTTNKGSNCQTFNHEKQQWEDDAGCCVAFLPVNADNAHRNNQCWKV